MNLTVRQLRDLVAVADERSFTAAASVRGVSQASVSRSIAALESEIGSALVARTTRSVGITSAGDEIVTAARRALDELDRAVAHVRGDPRDIRLGYAWAALGAHTTSVLRGWNREYPATPLRMVHAASRDVGLSSGRTDFAVARHHVAETAFDSAVLGREARQCAVAIDHPLADRGSLSLRDALPYVVGVDAQTGTTTPRLWLDAGEQRTPELAMTEDIDEWLDQIAEGRIIGITSVATAHHQPRPGVVFLPIEDAEPIRVRLVWRRGSTHPARERLIAHLRQAYAR